MLSTRRVAGIARHNAPTNDGLRWGYGDYALEMVVSQFATIAPWTPAGAKTD